MNPQVSASCIDEVEALTRPADVHSPTTVRPYTARPARLRVVVAQLVQLAGVPAPEGAGQPGI